VLSPFGSSRHPGVSRFAPRAERLLGRPAAGGLPASPTAGCVAGMAVAVFGAPAWFRSLTVASRRRERTETNSACQETHLVGGAFGPIHRSGLPILNSNKAH